VPYAICVLPQKVDMASRRYFDASYLVSGSLWIFHPSRSWPFFACFWVRSSYLRTRRPMTSTWNINCK